MSRTDVLDEFLSESESFDNDPFEMLDRMADEIVRLRELVATVDAEREHAYQVAQQNEQAARRMDDRIRELEAQLTLPPIREKFVRVSDELMAELKAAPSKPVTVAIVEDGNELHMTFTEAQQAASEPVAWADRLADAVRKLVRVLNDGDDVSALALALEATEKALAQFDDSKRCCGLCDAGECKYEIAPPSAAGVSEVHDPALDLAYQLNSAQTEMEGWRSAAEYVSTALGFSHASLYSDLDPQTWATWMIQRMKERQEREDAVRRVMRENKAAIASASTTPSAAAVRVTDAMVRTAFVRLYPGCEPDEMQHYHAADIRAALTAALTAASEGASA